MDWSFRTESLKKASVTLCFQTFEILTALRVQKVNVRHLPNFVAISQTVMEVMSIFRFLKWRPSATLYLL